MYLARGLITLRLLSLLPVPIQQGKGHGFGKVVSARVVDLYHRYLLCSHMEQRQGEKQTATRRDLERSVNGFGSIRLLRLKLTDSHCRITRYRDMFLLRNSRRHNNLSNSGSTTVKACWIEADPENWGVWTLEHLVNCAVFHRTKPQDALKPGFVNLILASPRG